MKQKKQLFVYTIGFLILGGYLMLQFQVQGYSMVRWMDGAVQHLNTLYYIRQYWIDFFQNGFQFKMVDLNLGQGLDVIGVLNYYGFGDPITLLSVLIPENSMEIGFGCLTLFRLYLSGMFFICFCREMGKKEELAVSFGGLLYAFCSFALTAGMKHPLFINGIMYLPLLLTGMERILKGKSGRVLAVSVGFAFPSNYYFMYINTLLLGLYFLVRMCGSYRTYGIKGTVRIIGRAVGAYLLGVCLGAVILFPAIYAFSQNARGAIGETLPLIRSESGFYIRLLKGMIYSGDVHGFTVPGTAAVGLAGMLIILVCKKDWKKNRHLILGFLLMLLMYALPIVGKIMNGFSYSTNRWSYAMAFLLSYASVKALEDVKNLSKKQWILLGILFVAIVFATNSIPYERKERLILEISLTVLGFSFAGYGIGSHLQLRQKKKVATGVSMVVLFVGVFWNITQLYGGDFFRYTGNYIEQGTSAEMMGKGAEKLLENVTLTSGYRIETETNNQNLGAFLQLPTNEYYYSVIPKELRDLYVSLGFAKYARAAMLHNLEGRRALQMLSASKYSMTVRNGEASIQENELTLPIGYTYEKAVTREDYDQMSVLERQLALTETAVVNEAELPANIETSDSFSESITDVPYSLKKAEDGTSWQFTFQSPANTETYLVLEQPKVSKGLFGFQKIIVEGERKTDLQFTDKKYSADMKRKLLAVHLGYSKSGMTNATIHFNYKGKLKYADLKLQALNMEDLEAAYQKRSKEVLEDIQVGTNQISGKIEVSSDKILQLAVPHSIGWKAYVDGKETKIFHSGIAYMGIALDAGQHEIVFRYCSPGILSGAIISALALMVLIFWCVYRPKRGNTRLVNSKE